MKTLNFLRGSRLVAVQQRVNVTVQPCWRPVRLLFHFNSPVKFDYQNQVEMISSKEKGILI